MDNECFGNMSDNASDNTGADCGSGEYVWSLYLMPLTEEAIELALTYEHCRITPEYVLVYATSKREVPRHSVKLKADNLGLLSDGDTKWLLQCFFSDAQEYAQEHCNDLTEDRINFLKEFEEQLAAAEKCLQAQPKGDGR